MTSHQNIAIAIAIVPGFLDQELLSLKKFEEYKPVDANALVPTQKSNQGPTGKYMVLGIIIFKRILSERLNKLLYLSSVVDPFHFDLDPDPRVWIWIILKTILFFFNGLIIHVY